MLEQKPAPGAHQAPRPDTASTSASSRPGAFESFSNREFRWFYAAMLGQMAAMNMQLLVPALLAFELTGSYAALGIIGISGALPMFLLSMFGGVLADRVPKRSVLLAGQLFSLLNSGVMSALVFTGLISMEWIYLSALVQGIILALIMPASQAIIPDIVGMDRLMNAVSLNFAGMHTTQLIAPAAGGFIISFAGFDWAFLAMASFYGIALLSLSRLSWQPATLTGDEGITLIQLARKSLDDIKEGLCYIRDDRLMLILLSISFATAIFAMPHLFLLPGYVADIFDGGGSEVGIMFSVSAVGSLAAMLGLAASPARHRGLLVLIMMMVLGAGLVLFAQTGSYLIAAAVMVPIGIGSALRLALLQGLVQQFSEQAYRGRVMAVFMMQWSIMQVATLVVGVVAEVTGIQPAFMGLGIGLMLVTLAVYFFIPSIRHLD